MQGARFSASGTSFGIHEWRGSGPATLHVHNSDDEAWHVLDGELTFRYGDRTETAGPGTTVFVPAGVAPTFTREKTPHLIFLPPPPGALLSAPPPHRDPSHQPAISPPVC